MIAIALAYEIKRKHAARNLLQVTAVRHHSRNRLFAITTRLLTALPTHVIVDTYHFLAWLRASVFRMVSVVGVANPFAGMSTVKSEPTRTQASSFWDLVEVLCTADSNPGFLRVILATKSQFFPEITHTSRLLGYLAP